MNSTELYMIINNIVELRKTINELLDQIVGICNEEIIKGDDK